MVKAPAPKPYSARLWSRRQSASIRDMAALSIFLNDSFLFFIVSISSRIGLWSFFYGSLSISLLRERTKGIHYDSLRFFLNSARNTKRCDRNSHGPSWTCGFLVRVWQSHFLVGSTLPSPHHQIWWGRDGSSPAPFDRLRGRASFDEE